MVSYGIGLDIGIASVGWATVALDSEDRPLGIIGMGSRIFDAAEQPKTGDSLAAPRREARSARRRLRRHRHRNERIRSLLLENQVVSQEQMDRLFDGNLPDIYALRVRALDQPVSNQEFARILIHLAQRRGFRSNRKAATTKEDGELLAAVNANRERMAQQGYRTAGEMYLLDENYRDHKRNKGGNYIATVSRDMMEDEARQIFAAQRRFESPFASAELEAAYLEIFRGQRSFDEGPGGNSPYGGSQIERMIGRCTFEPEEPRAAKATYSFERFSMLEAVNHMRLISNGRGFPLTAEQREKLIALAHKTASPTYAKIRQVLGIPDGVTFNMVPYQSAEDAEAAEKKAKFAHLRAWHQMRSAFDKVSKGYFQTFSVEQWNVLGQTLSIYKTSAKIRPKLEDAGFSERDMDIAETLSFSKFGHLSVKACDKITPYLEQGMKYSDACEAAGYHFQGHDGTEKMRLLPPLGEEERNNITSPVVLRAVSQTIKVVNAIIRERGCSPTYIKIELARELAKNFAERNQLKKQMDENQAANERRIERIRTEYGKSNPTGLDLVKMKLFEQQDGICPYSLERISISRLFDPDYVEIDHIVPYSISFDDSYKNKVLVLAKENRNKGNRLPLQYLTGERRENFVVWVKNSVHDYKKRQRLLKEAITPNDEEGFKERNLQDTKTMSRFLLNYIRDHLEFAPFASERKKHMTAVNGSVTSYMRKRWGITKIRENGDLHHAVDALVIACTTDGMIQEISRYAQYRECQYTQEDGGSSAIDPKTGRLLKRFPYPWPEFRRELEARLGSDPARAVLEQRFPLYINEDIPVRPLFVSRMPRRKVTGSAHKETVKSLKAKEDGVLVVRKPLTDLKLKNGEIDGYYMPQSDRLLYEALKARLLAFAGDAKKAFAEPFHKPKSDGTPGPLVKKVKLCEPSTLYVSIHDGEGAADNDSMVRIDVFYIEGDGYYFVPIYVADTLKPELPNKACVAHMPYEKWKEMKDEDFLFSLYPNDLIRATHKKKLKLSKSRKESSLPDSYETKSELLYYISANISTASVSCRNHDDSYIIQSLGIKTLEKLEKYTVDVLGEYHPVQKEKRQAFHRRED